MDSRSLAAAGAKAEWTASRLGLILVIPLLTFIGELSNSLHGLYDTSMSLVADGPFWVVSAHRGPLAWLNLAYLFAALPYGSWLYLSSPRNSSHVTKRHNLVLVTSGLFPLFGYFLYLCGWSPWQLDLAPITFAATVILAYLAVFRFECFDLVPMAHSLVFNSMRDAAIVTDMQHRLVEFNPAARVLFPRLATAKPGAHIASAIDSLALPGQVLPDPSVSREIELAVDGEPQYFEVRVFPLLSGKQQLGRTAILVDITARRQFVDELRRHAETDGLTGVANRRSFMIALELESARSVRYQLAFSVIFVDLDYFKEINDQFGHAAGDRALRTVAERIMGCLRSTDLLSRFGGDEFAILLPQTGLEAASEVAARIQSVVAGSQGGNEKQAFNLSVSLGVSCCKATHAGDWKRLLDEADKALYSAKSSGRNRVAAGNTTASSSDAAVAASTKY